MSSNPLPNAMMNTDRYLHRLASGSNLGPIRDAHIIRRILPNASLKTQLSVADRPSAACLFRIPSSHEEGLCTEYMDVGIDESLEDTSVDEFVVVGCDALR